MPSENFTEESLEDHPRGTMHVLLFLWNEAMAMHMPVQRQSFAPHSIIYFGVTVTAPMKTARLCARCWCWPLGFSGSASLGGPGEIKSAVSLHVIPSSAHSRRACIRRPERKVKPAQWDASCREEDDRDQEREDAEDARGCGLETLSGLGIGGFDLPVEKEGDPDHGKERFV